MLAAPTAPAGGRPLGSGRGHPLLLLPLLLDAADAAIDSTCEERLEPGASPPRVAAMAAKLSLHKPQRIAQELRVLMSMYSI
jgi:hypothetical protein